MRLIDADHLKSWILSRVFKTQLNLADVIDQIDREDTIEPNRKVGHWKFDWKHNKATCSECGHTFKDAFDIDNFDNFCRHCGAKMEGNG